LLLSNAGLSSRVLFPSHDEIRRVVLHVFKITPDTFFVVRRKTVAQIVAVALGYKWSAKLSSHVAEVVEGLGAVPAIHEHRHLWKGMVPRNLTEVEARKLSAEIKGTKAKGRQ
jgi:hypothetical protein